MKWKNIWMEHIRNLLEQLRISVGSHIRPMKYLLYGNIPKISDTLRTRRLKFFGHNIRADGPISSGMFYDPKLNTRKKLKGNLGASKLTYIDVILNDTRLVKDELPSLIKLAKDREKWRELTIC